MGATDVLVRAPAAAPAITWRSGRKQSTVRGASVPTTHRRAPPHRALPAASRQGGPWHSHPQTAAAHHTPGAEHPLLLAVLAPVHSVCPHPHTHLAQHLAPELLWGQLLLSRGSAVLQRHGYAGRRRGAGRRHVRARRSHRTSRFSSACIAPTCVLAFSAEGECRPRPACDSALTASPQRTRQGAALPRRGCLASPGRPRLRQARASPLP